MVIIGMVVTAIIHVYFKFHSEHYLTLDIDIYKLSKGQNIKLVKYSVSGFYTYI